MRADENSAYYEGVFAELMAGFIKYKRAQGLKYESVSRLLRTMSKFLEAHDADLSGISRPLMDEWCSMRPNESRRTREIRISYASQFARYLVENGVPASLPRITKKSPSSFVPYIYSPKELQGFFNECGKVKARTPSVMPDVLPVLFRLLLCCGLRVSEALALMCRDVDLNKGQLTVRNAKGGKDRLAPISGSLLVILLDYNTRTRGMSFSLDEPFFCHRDKRPINHDVIYRWFRKVLWKAGISHNGHGPRVHDFRHTFAVYSLKSMVDRGMDIYCALPILSTYLGHATISATGQYVRLTQDMFPEIVDKTSAIAAFVIPGGDSV